MDTLDWLLGEPEPQPMTIERLKSSPGWDGVVSDQRLEPAAHLPFASGTQDDLGMRIRFLRSLVVVPLKPLRPQAIAPSAANVLY